jgi:DNA-directed RNA polymerase subunit L
MAKFIGSVANVGIAKEAVRGTAEASAAFWLPHISMSVDDGIEQAVDENTIGVIADAQEAQVVSKFAVGEIEGNILDKSFGLILFGALGAKAVSGPTETSVYTHTFTAANTAQHQSFTLFLDDANQDYKYPLACIDSLKIDAEVGKYAKYTAGFRSKVGSTATNTPTYSAENRFLPQHVAFQYATNVAGLASPTTAVIRKVNLSINKNIEDDRKLGSVDQVDILNKQMTVEGSVEMVFDAETFKTQMLADTQQAVRIEITNADVTIGTTLKPRIRIDMAKVKFSSFQKKYESANIVTATINFKALYSLADSSMISCELRNTQVSY